VSFLIRLGSHNFMTTETYEKKRMITEMYGKKMYEHREV
jgi:hypothetical protein